MKNSNVIDLTFGLVNCNIASLTLTLTPYLGLPGFLPLLFKLSSAILLLSLSYFIPSPLFISPLPFFILPFPSKVSDLFRSKC
jgi:hypothetical protein